MRLAAQRSLANLGLDYVDLYLVHRPCALKFDTANLFGEEYDNVPQHVTWTAMEALVTDGTLQRCCII